MRVEEAVSDGFQGRFEDRGIGSLDMHREVRRRALKRTIYSRERFSFCLVVKNTNEEKKCSRHDALPERLKARPKF